MTDPLHPNALTDEERHLTLVFAALGFGKPHAKQLLGISEAALRARYSVLQRRYDQATISAVVVMLIHRGELQIVSCKTMPEVMKTRLALFEDVAHAMSQGLTVGEKGFLSASIVSPHSVVLGCAMCKRVNPPSHVRRLLRLTGSTDTSMITIPIAFLAAAAAVAGQL